MSDTDNLDIVPTVAEYRRVLPGCLRASRTQQEKEGRSTVKDMLQAHYAAPDHTITAGGLAEMVNLTNYGDVNLRYGKFARLLCEQLGLAPKYYVAVFATFGDERRDGEFVRWTMRPEFVKALEDLGWVKRTSPRAD